MSWLKRLITFHPLLTLAVMLAAAMAFGLLSFNLFFFLKGNIELVRDHGVQALMEGALEELLQLFLYGVLSLIFYLIFKACENVLVERILK